MILQQASDDAEHVSHQFHTFTDGSDLDILLNRDAFEPDAVVFPMSADPSLAKTQRGLVALVVRGLLRRLLRTPPQSILLSPYPQQSCQET